MSTLLIANRGEIALRIMRTARQQGYRTVAIFSDADRGTPHVQAADMAIPIGGNTPQESYLDINKVIAAARESNADCVHPGYGFLSENADFARACDDAGLTFIGPPAAAIELMGNKRRAKDFAARAGVPCIPGYQGAGDHMELTARAADIGYPLMLKAAAGGGGRGMRLVTNPDDLEEQLRSARAESLAAFGSDEIILEKAISNARHIEIQVFADQHGNCIHLGERDCSIQRRHQKVVEEAPSPAVSAALREAMGQAAVTLAQACDYTGAGTVEFLLDAHENFFFLEMNTRLQVEHGVTELITGTDLVSWQLQVAEGKALPAKQSDIRFRGHAIEVRLYAEDPQQDFLPQSGTILRWSPHSDAHNSLGETQSQLRFDHAVAEGLEISPYYDPMLGKLMAWEETRDAACGQLSRALQELPLIGPRNNRFFLQQILEDPTFCAGAAHTGFLTQQFTPRQTLPVAQDQARALAAALLHHRSIPVSEITAGRANWQSNRPALTRLYRLDDGGDCIDVNLRAINTQCYHAQLPSGEEVTLDLLAPHLAASSVTGGSVAVNDVQQPVQWHVADRQLTLIFQGRQWGFHDVTYAPAESTRTQSDGRIRAPMEGNLTQVCVSVGEVVARGDLLATMEAMKMEHALKADCDGIVSAIDTCPGSQVKSGQILIQIALSQAPVEEASLSD